MPDIPKAFDVVQEARGSLDEIVDTLMRRIDEPLKDDDKGNAVSKIEAAIALIDLLRFAATKPLVTPHLPKIWNDVSNIARHGRGYSSTRAAKLMYRIAELDKMPAKPRKVVVKIITEPPREKMMDA